MKKERKPYKALNIDLDLSPVFILTPGEDGNGIPVLHKTGVVFVGLGRNQHTQVNLYGKPLLYSTIGMKEHGEEFQKLVERFEGGSWPFEPQTRTACEGGFPLILYMTDKSTIVREPWGIDGLSLLALGENPLEPGKSYQVDYLGPRVLTTYEEARDMGLPFIPEIRKIAREFNEQRLDRYDRFKRHNDKGERKAA